MRSMLPRYGPNFISIDDESLHGQSRPRLRLDPTRRSTGYCQCRGWRDSLDARPSVRLRLIGTHLAPLQSGHPSYFGESLEYAIPFAPLPRLRGTAVVGGDDGDACHIIGGQIQHARRCRPRPIHSAASRCCCRVMIHSVNSPTGRHVAGLVGLGHGWNHPLPHGCPVRQEDLRHERLFDGFGTALYRVQLRTGAEQ